MHRYVFCPSLWLFVQFVPCGLFRCASLFVPFLIQMSVCVWWFVTQSVVSCSHCSVLIQWLIHMHSSISLKVYRSRLWNNTFVWDSHRRLRPQQRPVRGLALTMLAIHSGRPAVNYEPWKPSPGAWASPAGQGSLQQRASNLLALPGPVCSFLTALSPHIFHSQRNLQNTNHPLNIRRRPRLSLWRQLVISAIR